jgi:predicted anti-sigma-YlaC factor YlaD
MSAPLLLTCRQFTVLSTDYLDDRLGSFRRVQAWFHLSWCARCRAYLQQMRQTIALLGRLARRESPQEVQGDLLRRFRDRYGRGPGS